MPGRIGTYRSLRAKLIFNSVSGRPEDSPRQLAEILTEMQSRNILPEVFMVGPDGRLEAVVRKAMRGGIKLIVVAGGDGTIDSLAGAMAGSSATLGIIPTGTRNNVAFNLGIPNTIPEAVALLREGRRSRIDLGSIRSGAVTHWFLEAATLGLLSDLFPVADGIHHGDLAQIGSLLSTLVSSTPSQLRVILGGRQRLKTSAYVVLIANMPYIGPRFQVSPDVSYDDRNLDLFVFSEMGKLDLLSYAVQSGGGEVENAHIKHYRVKELTIHSAPQMPVLADGILLDPGPVRILVHPRALSVIAGPAGSVIGGSS